MDTRKLGSDGMFITVTVAVESQVYAYVQNHQIIYIKYVQFFVCVPIYFNEDDSLNKEIFRHPLGNKCFPPCAEKKKKKWPPGS